MQRWRENFKVGRCCAAIKAGVAIREEDCHMPPDTNRGQALLFHMLDTTPEIANTPKAPLNRNTETAKDVVDGDITEVKRNANRLRNVGRCCIAHISENAVDEIWELLL